MIPLPRRLRSFSLRTLMVLMTALSAWLAWEQNAVSKRRALLAGFRRSPAITPYLVGEYNPMMPRIIPGPPEPSIPWIRRAFGDVPVEMFVVSGELNQRDRETVERYFPEAMVQQVWLADVMSLGLPLPTVPDFLAR